MLSDFLDSLFDDIGGKIKGLVKWSFALEAILVVVAGIVAMLDCLFSGRFLLFLLIPFAAVAALAVLWVGSWVMYAFGEMVQRVCNIDDRLVIAGKKSQSDNEPKKDAAAKEQNDKSLQKAAVLIREEKNQRAIQGTDEQARWKDDVMLLKNGEKNRHADAAELVREEHAGEQNENTGRKPLPENQELADKLTYALAFKTDDGMIRYLRSMDHERVNQILKEPRHKIRKLIECVLEEL